MDITAMLFLGLLFLTLARVSSLWVLSIAYGFRRVNNVDRRLERISIIVPAYNEESSLASSVQSLLNINYQDFEVIIVDDGSRDRTLEIARQFEGPGVKVLHQENRGKAEAINSGIRVSSGSIILTVDADTRLNPESLRQLATRFSGRGRLGALAGNVRIESPRGFLQRIQQVEYASSIGLVRRGQSMLGSVMIVPGPIAALRKEAIEKAGYFSGETFAEDFDMTLAILRAGYTVEYEDHAAAYTIAPHNVEDLLKQRRRWYRGMIQVLAKHEGMFFRKKYGVAGVYGVPFMWFDSISPIINIFLSLFAVISGFFTGDWITILAGLAAYWALQTVVAVSAIAFDSEKHWWEILMSPILIFYNTFLDGIRVGAFAEEMLTLGMTWETPRR